jgi:hypothetical protein
LAVSLSAGRTQAAILADAARAALDAYKLNRREAR